MMITGLLHLLALAGVACGTWVPTVIVSPTYPVLATHARIEGRVDLRLQVNRDGHIAAVRVLTGNKILAAVASGNIKNWRFSLPCKTPPAESIFEFTYEFRLRGIAESRPPTEFVYEHPYKVFVTSEALHWNPSK